MLVLSVHMVGLDISFIIPSNS